MSEKLALDAGEHLIWSGRPIPLWFAIRRTRQSLLLAIVFTVMCVIYLDEFALRTNPRTPGTIVFAQFVFAAVTGIASLCGFIVTLWLWRSAYRTAYYLTDRRVVIDVTAPAERRMSIPLEHVRFVELRSGLIGPSDLIFTDTQRLGIRGDGFIAIPDAAYVERSIRDAIERTFATRSRSPWQ